MTEDVIKLLSQERPDPLHDEILASTKDLVKRSRSDMAKHYDDWDLQDAVYRGERPADADDLDQKRKGKPAKMIVPNTFAQVMSFTSFLFLMFNQNSKFFELDPTGEEDYATKRLDSELLLQQNLKKNQWNNVLYQHLLDIGRFGPAIIENSWTRKLSHIYVTPEPQVINVNGVSATLQPGSAWQDVVKYEGNLIRPVSPYRFFPDTTHPLTDFQKGRFCASEEDYNMGQLYELQSVGEVAGVEFIEALPRDLSKSRGGETRSTVATSAVTRTRQFDSSNHAENVIVTKVQRWIVPSQFKFGPKEKRLGQEEFPVLYHLWYANDNRLIRCEPAMWWHNTFGWNVSQFNPDMQRDLNLGLADLVYALQDAMSWFVNSHISSVRRVIQNRLVVNSNLIDPNSLDGEGDIYVRKGVNRPVTDAFAQLRVQDVTSGHMDDVDLLGKLMEAVTGVNGNAMGQYNSGRRSAQESRVVTAGAAGRMKMHGHLIFESSLAPLAQQMLSNLRQSLSFEQFARVIGSKADQNRYNLWKGTPQEVAAGDDFFTFDSTLASEKGFIAQSLQELLIAIMSNPVAAQQLDLDPRAMLEEVQQLRGAGPMGRFSLSQRIQSGAAAPLPPIPMAQPGAAA